MKFLLLPVTDIMIGLYQTPVNADRFTNYMKILQGNTRGDIAMPVTFFNPMGKEHVLKKLEALKELKAEELIADTLAYINKECTSVGQQQIQVSLALADDQRGGWTNRYTTDYDSKFNLDELLKRGFCNPLFWVSESYTAEKIKERTADYCYRVLYRLTAQQPLTLEDHLQQEIFVAENNSFSSEKEPLTDFDKVHAYYQLYKDTTAYPTIFNFMYGDIACKELGLSAFGIPDAWSGFAFAAAMKSNPKKLDPLNH